MRQIQDSLCNFRDIATINRKIKPNKIFRSLSLTRYQNESFFPVFLRKYKIKKIVDLRDEEECKNDPYSNNSLKLFDYLHLPIDPKNQSEEFIKNQHYGTDIQIAYRHYALEHRHIFKSFFEQIDPAKDTILIHCNAGKDRTGCMVALLSLLMNESLQNVYSEYLKSEMDTNLENLNEFLKLVMDGTGVENFLLQCGITQVNLEHWKECLKQNVTE